MSLIIEQVYCKECFSEIDITQKMLDKFPEDMKEWDIWIIEECEICWTKNSISYRLEPEFYVID